MSSQVDVQGVTEEQLHILRHSLGLSQSGRGTEYRNYYCTGPDCDNYNQLLKLKEAGLMELGRISEPNHFFFVTEAGKVEARKNVAPLPKLTKSQRVYRAFQHSETSLSFIEFLRSDYYADLRRRA